MTRWIWIKSTSLEGGSNLQEELYYRSKSVSKKPIRISSNKAEIRAQVEEKCVFQAPVKKWVWLIRASPHKMVPLQSRRGPLRPPQRSEQKKKKIQSSRLYGLNGLKCMEGFCPPKVDFSWSWFDSWVRSHIGILAKWLRNLRLGAESSCNSIAGKENTHHSAPYYAYMTREEKDFSTFDC